MEEKYTSERTCFGHSQNRNETVLHQQYLLAGAIENWIVSLRESFDDQK